MALDAVLRCEHGDLEMPTGEMGYLDFYAPEVMDWAQGSGVKLDIQESQVGDITIYKQYHEHKEWTVQIQIAGAGLSNMATLEKLERLYDLEDYFTLYPYYLIYPAESYEVVWLNYNDFGDRAKRGYPEAGWAMKCVFKEPSGAICVPPS